MFVLLALSLHAVAKPLPFDTLTPTTPVPEKGALSVTRSATLAAPPEIILPYLADLQTWKSWTAWNTTTCPETEWTYTGTQGAVGATMAWSGKSCGDGRETITSVSASGTTFDTWFGKSDDAMKGRITLTPTAGGTQVEWQQVMSYGFPMSLFLSRKKMDTMLGADFEAGLAGLRTVAEADAVKAAEAAAKKAAEEAAAKKAAEEAAAKKAAEEAAAKAAEEAAAAAKAAEEAAKSKKKKK